MGGAGSDLIVCVNGTGISLIGCTARAHPEAGVSKSALLSGNGNRCGDFGVVIRRGKAFLGVPAAPLRARWRSVGWGCGWVFWLSHSSVGTPSRHLGACTPPRGMAALLSDATRAPGQTMCRGLGSNGWLEAGGHGCLRRRRGGFWAWRWARHGGGCA